MSTQDTARPELISVAKVWDDTRHAAFTDLTRFQDRWFLCFREATQHFDEDMGKIHLLTSSDGKRWTTACVLEEEGVDLRDPKLSITPDGKLMLLLGGSFYDEGGRYTRRPRVTFSDDGRTFEDLQEVLEPADWLWRLTWHAGQGYGMSYSFSDPDDPEASTFLRLFKTPDGVTYDLVTELHLEGAPNEATLRFAEDKMVCLVRRERASGDALIGTSEPPYTEWEWHETKEHMGGPNFLILDSGAMWAAGRILRQGPDEKVMELTAVAKMTEEHVQPLLPLPSGGDTSYPGMHFHEGHLFISYYSSHEGDHASIYFAKLLLP